MRVLHVITGLNAGGAETLLCNLSIPLKAAGFEQRVVSLLGEGPLGARIRENGIECRNLGLRRGYPDLSSFWRLADEIRDYRPAVIHGWMYHACLLAAVGSSLTGRKTPLLWGIHHAHLGFSHNSLSTLIAATLCGFFSFNKKVNLVYCAESSRKAHEERGYCGKRAVFIPNGYDPERFFKDAGAGAALRARLGIPADATVIGMAGRYDPIKDHATFLEAASIVRQADTGKIVFFLFGEGIAPSTDGLVSMIDGRGLTSAVVLGGRQEHMVAAYSALDVFVSSSRGEAFPNVICEAMLCELPCIVTDVGDCRAIIGDAGYVVPAGEPEALAQSIRSALKLSAEARSRLGAEARRQIAVRYPATKFLSRHISEYMNLVTDPIQASRGTCAT